MAGSTVDKLKIKPGMILRTMGAPADFGISLGALPEGVRVSSSAKHADQVHWFVHNKAQLEKELDAVRKARAGIYRYCGEDRTAAGRPGCSFKL